jgi:hypothetical protein
VVEASLITIRSSPPQRRSRRRERLEKAVIVRELGNAEA